MASLCGQCGLRFDDGPRLPKVLPCGHTACLDCLLQYARLGGRRCPVCRKVFKSDVNELVTLQQMADAMKMWCRDCDAEARPGCLELHHSLCGPGRVRWETVAELDGARANRTAALRRIEEELAEERRQLQTEAEAADEAVTRQDLATLRAALAAAKAHPLHGLADEGGVLSRALAALRREQRDGGSALTVVVGVQPASGAVSSSSGASFRHALAGAASGTSGEVAVGGAAPATLESLVGTVCTEPLVSAIIKVEVKQEELDIVDVLGSRPHSGAPPATPLAKEQLPALGETPDLAEQRQTSGPAWGPPQHRSLPGQHVPPLGHYVQPPSQQVPLPGQQVPSAGQQVPYLGQHVPSPGQQVPHPGQEAPPPGHVPPPGQSLQSQHAPHLEQHAPPPGQQVPLPGQHVPPPGRWDLPSFQQQVPLPNLQPTARPAWGPAMPHPDQHSYTPSRPAWRPLQPPRWGQHFLPPPPGQYYPQYPVQHWQSYPLPGQHQPAAPGQRCLPPGQHCPPWGQHCPPPSQQSAVPPEPNRGHQEPPPSQQPQPSNHQIPSLGQPIPHSGHQVSLPDQTEPVALAANVQQQLHGAPNSQLPSSAHRAQKAAAAGPASAPPGHHSTARPAVTADSQQSRSGAGQKTAGDDIELSDAAWTSSEDESPPKYRSVRKCVYFLRPSPDASEEDESESSDETNSSDEEEGLPAQGAVPTVSKNAKRQGDCSLDGKEEPSASLDVLPLALLERVLALVKPRSQSEFLGLRLVSRCWNRAMLSATVWRHRKLNIADSPALLRRLAAVDCARALFCFCTPAMLKAVVGALADPSCKVRRLELSDLPATAAASKLLKSALESRRWSLKELDLRLFPNHKKNDPSQFLPAIDGLRVLKCLALDVGESLSPVRYHFSSLSTLTRLSVGGHIHADTLRSLVRASAATLRKVECRTGRALQVLLSEPNAVHTVMLNCRAVVRGVSGLRQLSTLNVLIVNLVGQGNPEKPSRYLAKLLISSPLVPREVHLKVHFEELAYFSATVTSRITSLVVWSGRSCFRGVHAVGGCPALSPITFPDLEWLLVLECREDHAEWRSLKAAWSEASAPRLRELHLHNNSSGSPDANWAAQLKARRPNLRVCLSARTCWRWRSCYDYN